MSARPAAAVAVVPWVEARLRVDWPAGSRALRGAVCAALGAPEIHVDWHGHDTGRVPRVMYRTSDGAPRVVLWGARAEEHAGELLRQLHALRLPGGGVVPVEGVDIERRDEVVRVLGKSWRRYRLVTPLWPPDVAWRRRPRVAGDERRAWASRLLAEATEEWLAAAGVAGVVRVSLCWGRDEPVGREGQPERDAVGFVAEWLANADLPDGLGLGQLRCQGWGEVRRCR